MNTPWRALLWKEWRETRWKMAALGLLMGGFVMLSAWSGHPRPLDDLTAVGCLLAAASGAFVALGVAAGEISRGTQPFLHALPASTRSAAAVKLLMGAFAALVPAATLVASVVLIQAIAPWVSSDLADRLTFRGDAPALLGYPLLSSFVLLGSVGLSLYFWTAAFAVNADDEVRAGVRGIGALVLWTLLCICLLDFFKRSVLAGLFASIVAIGPGGFFAAPMWGPYAWWPIALSVAGHLAAAGWFIRRSGAVSVHREASKGSTIAAVAPSWLAPPRRSIATALVWKAYREAGPVVGAGLLGAVGLGALMAGINYATGDPQWPTVAAQAFTATFGFFAFMIAIVCGVGTVWGDVQPGINTFWRSRPAPPGLWFWSKCLVSIAMIGVAFSLPVVTLMSGVSFPEHMPQTMTGAATAAAVAFATAVLMTSLLRSAVYACILALCAGVATQSIVGSEPDWGLVPYQYRAELFVVLALAMLLVAWQAFRKDWSARG